MSKCLSWSQVSTKSKTNFNRSFVSLVDLKIRKSSLQSEKSNVGMFDTEATSKKKNGQSEISRQVKFINMKLSSSKLVTLTKFFCNFIILKDFSVVMPLRSVTQPLTTLILASSGIFSPSTLKRSTLAKFRFSNDKSRRLVKAMTLSKS